MNLSIGRYWLNSQLKLNEIFKQSICSNPWEIQMIARTWHGITEATKADEYLEYLNKTGIPEYRMTQGNLGVYVLRRIEGNKAHFLLLTLWESEDAIKRFAGSNMEKAKYYPEDVQYLLELEPNVTHYEVLVVP
jgi:heme-degrading monooxygenase HmoA